MMFPPAPFPPARAESGERCGISCGCRVLMRLTLLLRLSHQVIWKRKRQALQRGEAGRSSGSWQDGESQSWSLRPLCPLSRGATGRSIPA